MPLPLTAEAALQEIRRIACPDAPEGHAFVVAAVSLWVAKGEAADRARQRAKSGEGVMTYEGRKG